ncbi:MAG TPA: hypothetical protein VIR54_03695, partial [Vicinamibacterales bacterium]
ARAIQVAVLALLTVGGGAIVTTFGFAAGWIAETLLCAMGGVIAFAMIEPARGEDESDERMSSSRAKVPWRVIALLIVPLAFLDAAASTGSFLLQTTGNRGPLAVTLVVAVIALANAVGSAFATRLPETGVRMQLAIAALGSVVVAAALTIPGALVPATIALSFGTGTLHPLRASAIQRLASDGVRARAASAASAGDMALSTVFLLLAGGLITRKR